MNLGVTQAQLYPIAQTINALPLDAAIAELPPEIVGWAKDMEDAAFESQRVKSLTVERARPVLAMGRVIDQAQDKEVFAQAATAAYVTERDKAAAHMKVMPLWLGGAAAVGALVTWLLVRKK
jgi:hypothetical protein